MSTFWKRASGSKKGELSPILLPDPKVIHKSRFSPTLKTPRNVGETQGKFLKDVWQLTGAEDPNFESVWNNGQFLAATRELKGRDLRLWQLAMEKLIKVDSVSSYVKGAPSLKGNDQVHKVFSPKVWSTLVKMLGMDNDAYPTPSSWKDFEARYSTFKSEVESRIDRFPARKPQILFLLDQLTRTVRLKFRSKEDSDRLQIISWLTACVGAGDLYPPVAVMKLQDGRQVCVQDEIEQPSQEAKDALTKFDVQLRLVQDLAGRGFGVRIKHSKVPAVDRRRLEQQLLLELFMGAVDTSFRNIIPVKTPNGMVFKVIDTKGALHGDGSDVERMLLLESHEAAEDDDWESDGADLSDDDGLPVEGRESVTSGLMFGNVDLDDFDDLGESVRSGDVVDSDDDLFGDSSEADGMNNETWSDDEVIESGHVEKGEKSSSGDVQTFFPINSVFLGSALMDERIPSPLLESLTSDVNFFLDLMDGFGRKDSIIQSVRARLDRLREVCADHDAPMMFKDVCFRLYPVMRGVLSLYLEVVKDPNARGSKSRHELLFELLNQTPAYGLFQVMEYVPKTSIRAVSEKAGIRYDSFQLKFKSFRIFLNAYMHGLLGKKGFYDESSVGKVRGIDAFLCTVVKQLEEERVSSPQKYACISSLSGKFGDLAETIDEISPLPRIMDDNRGV